jgi:hypothetical protein
MQGNLGTNPLGLLVVGVLPELRLEPIYEVLLHLERLGQDIVRDGRLRSKHRAGDGDHPGVLAAERRQRGRGLVVVQVHLEVDHGLGEDEHVPLLDHLGEEPIGVGGDEAEVERPLEHGEELGGAGVDVRRVHAQGPVVDARERDAEGVEAGELRDVDVGDDGPEPVHGVPGLVEPGCVEEVVRGDGHRVLARESIHSHCTQRRSKHVYMLYKA